MTNCTHPFNPDWISPPGETIADLLEDLDWTQAQLAKRLGYTTKHVSQLVNGKAPITEDTALKLARVLGSTEEFWLEREAQYRAALVKVEETGCLESWVDWLDEIPIKVIKELQKACKITDCRLDAKNKPGIVRELLEFFDVASPDEWRACYAQLEGQFRRSYTGQDNTNVITTWMRLGELEVEKQSCPHFNRAKFEKAGSGNSDTHGTTTGRLYTPSATALFGSRGVVGVGSKNSRRTGEWVSAVVESPSTSNSDVSLWQV